MEMEAKPGKPHYPTDWNIRFLCDCKKDNKEIRIHQGVAHALSSDGVHILSDHAICKQKKVAMQLMIPSLKPDAPQRIVKIIGHSIDTIKRENGFLSEIEFRHFEEDGKQILEKNLRQRFEPGQFAAFAQRA
jgi:hypothetical protein